MSSKKDYCSHFPETIQGIEIGQSCCKEHDNNVGMRGTYNPFTPHIRFYKCLKEKGITFGWRCIITFGGTMLSWIKQPWLWYKIYKYRKG